MIPIQIYHTMKELKYINCEVARKLGLTEGAIR